MVNINELEKKYFYYNKKVPYELKCGTIIYIYPVLLEDWYIFEECHDILAFNKMEIPIPEIIQMSYLQFLLEVLCGEKLNENKLKRLLNLCLHIDNIKYHYDSNGKPNIVWCDENDIIKAIISPKDFDDIKKIILFQNIPGYDDTYISKDVREVIDETIRLRDGKTVPLTVETKMAFLGNEIGLTNKDMEKMTYREFEIKFNMAVDRMDYQINKTAELIGNVKFNKKIEHLLRKTKKNKLEDFFTNADEFTNKINSVN